MNARTVGILLCAGLIMGATTLIGVPNLEEATPEGSTALAALLREHVAETRSLGESTERAIATMVWTAMGRTELEKADVALERGLATQAVRPALLARWLISVPAELGDLSDPEVRARSVLAADRSPERIERAAARIDSLRGAVDEEGLLLLVIAQHYHAKAREDIGLLVDAASAASEQPSPGAYRDAAVTALVVDADLDLVEALLAEAARHPGGLPGEIANLGELVSRAREAAARLAPDPELEREPFSIYYLAKNRYPTYMTWMLERGWREGAARMALEIHLLAGAHERARDGASVADAELSAALTTFVPDAGPLARAEWERAQILLIEAGENSMARQLIVESSELHALRTQVHAQLSNTP